ncbi:MAG: hypothetical protein HKO09_05780, partial [Croceitalea sp.]|nr:hypothetical protein [Croceitalea sp.]
MRTLISLLCFGVLFCTHAISQVKIGDSPQNIDPASVLELESNSKVLVITRVTTNQMNAIDPLRGALVYNTDEGCVFYFNGSSWLNLCAEQNTTNVGFELQDSTLILNDSDGNSVSITLDGAIEKTFTTDPIVNFRETIVITQNGDNFNFEVGEITGENIVNSSINGIDLQNNSITSAQLAPNSVGQDELQDNTVADLEIDYSQVTLNDFLNDAGFITNVELISQDPNNAITDVSGAFYDDSQLVNNIDNNNQLITDHIGLDNDLDDTNELLTNAELQGNELVLTEGGIDTRIDLSTLSNAGGNNQIAAEVPFSPSAETTSTNVQDALDELQAEITGISANGTNPNDELNDVFQVNGTNLEITDAGGTLQVPLTDINTDNQ